MALKRLMYLVVFVSLLGGCTGLDRKPQTLEEGLYIAAVQAEGLVLTANRAYSAGELSAKDHIQVIQQASRVSRDLQNALEACEVGFCAGADGTLDRVDQVLRGLALLVSRYSEE